VEQALGLPSGLAGAGYTSLAGFLLARFAELPPVGAWLDHAGYRYTVRELDDNRISEVEVTRLDEP